VLLKPNNVIGDEMKYVMRAYHGITTYAVFQPVETPPYRDAECSFGLGPLAQ
jgi:hypothetical protein